MLKKFHDKYNKGELSLREYLSAHRTILANDRTWLGYVRTALTFFVAGISLIKFFPFIILQIIGWLFVPAGATCLGIGFWKYRRVRYMIHSIKQTRDEITQI